MPRTNRSSAIVFGVISAILAGYSVYFLGIINYRKLTPAGRQWGLAASIALPILAIACAWMARRRWRASEL